MFREKPALKCFKAFCKVALTLKTHRLRLPSSELGVSYPLVLKVSH